MFGFRGGESADAVARKRGYMKDAQLQWPFLTNYDLSTIMLDGQNPLEHLGGASEEGR